MVEEFSAEGTTRSHLIEDDSLRQIGWWSIKFGTFHTEWHGQNDIPVYIRIEDENR